VFLNSVGTLRRPVRSPGVLPPGLLRDGLHPSKIDLQLEAVPKTVRVSITELDGTKVKHLSMAAPANLCKIPGPGSASINTPIFSLIAFT
jgi:hypothetical protein